MKQNWLKILQITILVGFILYVGRTLFIPLGFALLLSFIFYPMCRSMENKKLPRSLAIGVILLILTLFGALLGSLLSVSISQFVQQWEKLNEKITTSLTQFTNFLTTKYFISVEQQDEIIKNFLQDSLSYIFPFIRETISLSASSLTLLLLVPFFVAFILFYREILVAAVLAALPTEAHEKFKSILRETVTTYYHFIKGMTVVYLCVGVLNTLGLWILGIPNALFFGFLASVLTFIPYLGIMIGGSLPVAIAWTSSDSFWLPTGVLGIFIFVQYLEANVIFPWAVSYNLKINTFATFLAIIIGSLVWGGAGMILFIPFAAVLKIIADRTKGLEPIAIFLGTELPEKSVANT